jgi:hypothetical protein
VESCWFRRWDDGAGSDGWVNSRRSCCCDSERGRLGEVDRRNHAPLRAGRRVKAGLCCRCTQAQERQGREGCRSKGPRLLVGSAARPTRCLGFFSCERKSANASPADKRGLSAFGGADCRCFRQTGMNLQRSSGALQTVPLMCLGEFSKLTRPRPLLAKQGQYWN